MNECDEVDEQCSLPYDLPTFQKWEQFPKFYHPLMAGSIDGTDIVAHDRAIIRASKSKYSPNKRVKGDPYKTLMVRHLSHQTKEASVARIFSGFGELKKCRLVRDVVTGRSRGYAFVEFHHESDMRNALRESKDLVIDDSKIVTDVECERTLPGWIPRRFGGGFGGRKESGQLRFGGIERPFRRPLPLNSKPLNSKEGMGSSSLGSKKRNAHSDVRSKHSASMYNSRTDNKRFKY